MTEPPLVIPFLPDAEVGGALPVTAERVVAWTATTPSGPSRRIAIAGQDNTLWITTSVSQATSYLAPLGLAIPGSSSSASPYRSSSSGRPRPRATSSASSIISCSSRGGKRVFSPTASTSALAPTPALSAVSASPEPSKGHIHRPSISDRAELLETLKSQVDADDRGSLGLGIAGLTRRGLNVHSKEDLESASAKGDTTPTASVGSASSESTTGPSTVQSSNGQGHTRARTASRLTDFWGRNAAKEEEEAAQANKDEMDVEREMAREEAQDAKEAEDLKIVGKTAERTMASSPVTPLASAPASVAGELTGPLSPPIKELAPLRIVLPNPGRGQIVQLAVFESVGELVVLRDVGLLDVISLSDLQLTRHIDLDAATISTSKQRTPRLEPAWLWQRVHLAAREEGVLLISNGVPWPTAGPSPNGEVTRVVMLAFPDHECVATLDLPGVGDVGIASNGESSYLLHATSTSLMSYSIVFPSSIPPSRSTTPVPKSATSPSVSSPLIRGEHGRKGASSRMPSASAMALKAETSLAKFLATRRTSKKTETVSEFPIAVGVAEGVEVQRDGGGHWTCIRLHDNGQGIGIGGDHAEVFDFDGAKLNVRGSITVEGKIIEADFTTGWHDVCIVTDTETTVLARDGRKQAWKWNARKTYPAHAVQVQSGIIYAAENSAITSIDLSSLERTVEVKLVAPVANEQVCFLGADTAFVADKFGAMRKQTLSEYIHHAPTDPDAITADRLKSSVTCSATVSSEYAAGGRFLVAGDEDGSVRIWDANALYLRGSWTLFDDAVRTATILDMEEAGSLRGCVLFTSTKGSVAVVSLREMDELFLLPAARAPLTRIFVGGRDILLAYENSKARVWNVETKEFRRSTGLDSAEDMMSTPGWAEVYFQPLPQVEASYSAAPAPVSNVVRLTPLGSDLGRLLQLDLRELGRWLHAERDDQSPLSALRGLLSVFLTFGINPAIDEVCTNNLTITPPSSPVAVGIEGPSGTSMISYTSPAASWRVSSATTGLRQLAIVSLLRPFLDSPDYESYAADVIAFYTACLPDDAIEAELELFAAYYLDSAVDVHQAARMLFAARLSRMSNEVISELVTAQQDYLPSVVPVEQRMSESAARALTMIGGMALHRFECMNPTALKAVAESIQLYLNDPSRANVGLAIELCCKGFSTWQTYIDPMNLLRRLFYLATSKDATGAHIAAQARIAVLHVASSNAPLFMSTLSMDILDAKSAEGSTSIMKLCVFMARKRPALLENGLPRICEAVVKSLDPNAGKMRDDVWEAATVILNELVQAFTTVDFHSGTQKLVVGTNEGAVIMYELKTASRLYVIEPHHAPVSAVAFSPDGRRLVTVSLDGGEVTVWKVGSSLSGLFNVGGPPRQGGDRGAPYKRIPFMRPSKDADEDTGALSNAQISWRGNRQVLVTIKETALNFETT